VTLRVIHNYVTHHVSHEVKNADGSESTQDRDLRRRRGHHARRRQRGQGREEVLIDQNGDGKLDGTDRYLDVDTSGTRSSPPKRRWRWAPRATARSGSKTATSTAPGAQASC